jgi:hypothetical protein
VLAAGGEAKASEATYSCLFWNVDPEAWSSSSFRLRNLRSLAARRPMLRRMCDLLLIIKRHAFALVWGYRIALMPTCGLY